MEQNLGNAWGGFASFIFMVFIPNTMLEAWKDVSKYSSFAFNIIKSSINVVF